MGLHQKASAQQRKQSPNSRDHSQNGRKSLLATLDKGLISTVYRELKKLNSSQINEPIKRWATELNRTFQRKKSK
jgi:hypothetical protein